MPTKVGDTVLLSEAEVDELQDLQRRIPREIIRTKALFTNKTMKEYFAAETDLGRMLRRYEELLGG